jgi:hypothetical protein
MSIGKMYTKNLGVLSIFFCIISSVQLLMDVFDRVGSTQKKLK